MNRYMQVDWCTTERDAVQVIPVGHNTVHVTRSEGREPTLETGWVFLPFGTEHVVRTSAPIIIGSGGVNLVLARSKNISIVRRVVNMLLAQGARPDRMALSAFVPHELMDSFSERVCRVARQTGFTNLIVTSLDTLAEGKSSVTFVRPPMWNTGGYTLH